MCAESNKKKDVFEINSLLKEIIFIRVHQGFYNFKSKH